MRHNDMRESKHTHYLDELLQAHNLESIDEDPYLVRVIFREPVWKNRNTLAQLSQPDIFIGYDDRWSVIELKGSEQKRWKAIEQIMYGKRCLVDALGIPMNRITGKFVVYSPHGYKYEVIDGR